MSSLIDYYTEKLEVLNEQERKIWEAQCVLFEQASQKKNKSYNKNPTNFPKGTMVHWVKNWDSETLDSIAQNGIITSSIIREKDTDSGTRFCADFFVAKRDETARDFYHNLSRKYLFKGKVPYFDSRVNAFIPYVTNFVSFTDRVGFVFFPSEEIKELSQMDCYSADEKIAETMSSISGSGAGWQDFNANGHEGVASILLGIPYAQLGALIIHDEEYDKCTKGLSTTMETLQKCFPDVPIITTNNQIVYTPAQNRDNSKIENNKEERTGKIAGIIDKAIIDSTIEQDEDAVMLR